MKNEAAFWIVIMLCSTISWIPYINVLGQPALIEEQGSLVDVVNRFRADIIPRDSGRYVVPTEAHLKSIGNAFALLLEWMNTESSDRLAGTLYGLAEVNCALVKFADTSGRVFYIVREAAGYSRGWGIYVVFLKAPRTYRNLLIEVPHIGFDEFTEKIGVRSFSESWAGFLFIAGAHRYANPGAIADVAHTEQCVFHVVHRTFCTNTSIAVQIHGFAETSAGREFYPQVVLSSGAREGSSTLTQMADLLTQNGLTVGTFDGTKYTDLGATENVQGKYTRNIGAAFVHMEISRAVRTSDELGGKIASGIERFADRFIIEIPQFQLPMVTLLATVFVSWSMLAFQRRRTYRLCSKSHM